MIKKDCILHNDAPFGISFQCFINSYFVFSIKVPSFSVKTHKTCEDNIYFYTNAISKGRFVFRVRCRNIRLLKKWVHMSWFKRLTRCFILFCFFEFYEIVSWDKRETIEQAKDRLGTEAVF